MYMVMGSAIGEDDVTCSVCDVDMAKAVIDTFEKSKKFGIVSSWKIGESSNCLYRAVLLFGESTYTVKINKL